MKTKLCVLSVVAAAIFCGTAARVSAAPPPAPAPLAPASGAGVQEPFTISWSSVSDPSGIVAYNWQVSSSSSFTPVILQDSTNGQTTADTVSGLAIGTYFWRVQAVNGAFEPGAWSAARSFSVTGVGPGAPGTPSLGPPKGYTTFHPYEVMTFNWSAAPGASTYVFQAATDPSFPVATRIQFDNIPNTTYSFAIGNPEGNYFARVFAVNANGIFSAPSNVISFSVFFNNPLPPPPSPLSPPNGATLTLPITITWTDVPNPQPSGYDLQIARDSNFQSIEALDSQLNDPARTVLSLTPGQKFWRVHSVQGNSSPTTAAVTAWSTTGTFTVSSAPPTPVSVSFTTNPLTSGQTTWVQLQLTGAPPTPTTIALTSSNASAAPVPASITMPANTAWTQFQLQAGQVVSATPVTITATLNGKSASGNLTVAPTALRSLSFSPSTINGGAQAGGIVMLSGQAPAGGAIVTLTSNSAAVSPPPSVFVNPGSFSVSFPLQTNAVTANTSAVVTANWNGTSVQAPLTLTAQPAPASLTLDPTSTVGTGGSSFGTVTVASAQPTDTIFQLTSSHPAIAQVNTSVMVPAGAIAGGFNVFTTQVTAQTVVTISVTGGGVTKSTTLTVMPDAAPPPPPAATLSAFTVSPTSVVGGSSSTGTVTLSSAAPSGGTVVTLSSNQPGAASVPASVTVAAGATTASFPITTFPSAGTTVQLAATLGSTTLFAALGVTQGSSTQTATLTVTATGRSGERITSTPTGINVTVGSSGSGAFPTGTSITLKDVNGRDVIWSGACSSGGNKTKSCTFTLNANASVTANVQ